MTRETFAEPLVAEDAVTELLAIDLPELQRHLQAATYDPQSAPLHAMPPLRAMPAGTGVDQDRNLYKPSAIAAWLNDCDRRLRLRR